MSFGFERAGEGEKVSRMRQNGRALAAVSVWKNDVSKTATMGTPGILSRQA